MKSALFFGSLLLASAASAQTPSNATADGAGAGAGATNDPNAQICRTVRETGSMLGRTRVCMTRAQWEEQRRQTRANIDRAQTTRTNPGGN